MPQRNPDTAPTRQERLRRRYREDPGAARICSHARAVGGAGTDTFRGEVEPAADGGIRLPYGIQRAAGGDHDAPDPGDLLCSALAACLHSSARALAQWLHIEVIDLEVRASAQADVRGMLGVDPLVPVGFQRLHCDAYLEVPAGTRGSELKVLMASTERYCMILQTLRAGTDVAIDWHIDQELDANPSGKHSDSRTQKEVQS